MRIQQIISLNERYIKLIDMVQWIMDADQHLYYTADSDIDIEAGMSDVWQPSEHAQALCKPILRELVDAIKDNSDTSFDGDVYQYEFHGKIADNEIESLNQSATDGVSPVSTPFVLSNVRRRIESRLTRLYTEL